MLNKKVVAGHNNFRKQSRENKWSQENRKIYRHINGFKRNTKDENVGQFPELKHNKERIKPWGCPQTDIAIEQVKLGAQLSIIQRKTQWSGHHQTKRIQITWKSKRSSPRACKFLKPLCKLKGLLKEQFVNKVKSISTTMIFLLKKWPHQ